MKNVQGLSSAALTLLFSLVIAGCSPKEEPVAEGTPAPVRQTAQDSAQPAKLETATLKAVGMT